MARYKLHKCTSITLKGIVLKKKENAILDSKTFGAERLNELAEAGTLILVDEKAEAKAKAAAEAAKKAEAAEAAEKSEAAKKAETKKK